MCLPCTRDLPHSVAASVPSPASRAACSQALHDRRALGAPTAEARGVPQPAPAAAHAPAARAP
eukprot:796153-Prymnesium_polylepis.1